MRRVHAALIGAAAVLLVALTTAFLIDWAPLAGDRITRSVSRALGRSVTIAGSIHMRPTFSGLKSKAGGIVIGNPDWARTDEFASIDSAELTFSWLPLIIGVFEPNRIEIRGALFELESRRGGKGGHATWQIGPLEPGHSGEPKGAMRFGRVPQLVVEDAAFAVTDAYGQLHDIAVRRFTLRRKGRGAIGNAELGDQGTPVKVSWNISSLQALKTESSEMALTVESDAGSVTASGTLGFDSDAGFDLRSYWDLSGLGQFGRNLGLTGLPDEMPLKANIRLAGRADAFALQLEKVESGRSRAHGVLQGRLVRQGEGGSAYNLLELTGEIASQRLDLTKAVDGISETSEGSDPDKAGGASLIDFLFGPGLVLKLDLEISALQLAVHNTQLKNASGRVISDARLLRLSGVSGRLGKGGLAFDLIMDRAGTAVQDVVVLFSGRDLDLGWLFDGLGMEPLLVAPADFAGQLRAAGAGRAELLANLSGAVHFAAGHGAMRGAAARGLALSGAKLPRLEGVEALSLDCLAGRVRFKDGIGILNGFMMRGSGFDISGQGYADLGRQIVDMRFSPVIRDSGARPNGRQAVVYDVTGPVDGPTVSRADAEPEGSDQRVPLPPSESFALPPLRGEVARNNPCLAAVRSTESAAQDSKK